MEVTPEFSKDHLQDNISKRLKDFRPDGATEHEQGQGDTISENTKSSTKFETFVMAGAAAGIMEHCVMYPVDVVKVGLLR